MQVVPIKPTLKAPGTKRSKLKYCTLLSSSAFDFNLRRYIKAIMNSGLTFERFADANTDMTGRGLHSFSFQLNLSRV
jgi:hypothetical protein